MFLQFFFLVKQIHIICKYIIKLKYTSLSASLNVLGNILGKSFKKIGNVNSINGTIINTEKGTSRNRSETVRVN